MTPEEKKAIDKYNQELLSNAPAILGGSALSAAFGGFLPVDLNKTLIKQIVLYKILSNKQNQPKLWA